jgi:hypothetical protein
MFGSTVLEVVIGLVFIYLLLSIICTAANEIVAALFSLRAKNLAKGIANLLADKRVKGLVELFYDHPLIKGLSRGTKKPSYIPAHTFALAFLDGIAPAKGDGAAVITEIKAAVNGLPGDSELKRALLVFLQQAGNDFPTLCENIETWFNDAMTRVSGWYKRKSQVITLVLAFIVTGLTNADTFQIVKNLSADPALRAAVAAQAQEFIKQQPGIAARHPGKESEPSSPVGPPGGGVGPVPAQPPLATPTGPKETMTETLRTLEQLRIPFGWQTMPKKGEWPNKVVGLFLTIFAVSLGAPFWFDILSKVSKVRSTGGAPEPTTKVEKREKPA